MFIYVHFVARHFPIGIWPFGSKSCYNMLQLIAMTLRRRARNKQQHYCSRNQTHTFTAQHSISKAVVVSFFEDLCTTRAAGWPSHAHQDEAEQLWATVHCVPGCGHSLLEFSAASRRQERSLDVFHAGRSQRSPGVKCTEKLLYFV